MDSIKTSLVSILLGAFALCALGTLYAQFELRKDLADLKQQADALSEHLANLSKEVEQHAEANTSTHNEITEQLDVQRRAIVDNLIDIRRVYAGQRPLTRDRRDP
jgi:cell division protein FtsL